MPYLENSKYKTPSTVLRNGHISTIYYGRIKQSVPPQYHRERLTLKDGDFLDIDFVIKNPTKAVILCHGLEGSSISGYNNRSSKYFLEHDYSVFAWNNRSCSGEMNRLPKLYHHASIGDLDEVIQHIAAKGFKEIYLLGFSMGGVQIMNYFGAGKAHPNIRAAVAASSPIFLKTSATILKSGINKIYLKNFVLKISKKLKEKSLQYPDLMDWEWLETMENFEQIDGLFTAPVHGFKDADDFYYHASPGNILDKIELPTLIINALDDPFLGEDAYPVKKAEKSEYVYLETPRFGGHCAFPIKNSPHSYPEIRALEFFKKFGN